jgi:hypothetical protein
MPSKWLTWTPKIASSANVELTKPTKKTFVGSEKTPKDPQNVQKHGVLPTSVSSVSALPGHSQKIRGVRLREEPPVSESTLVEVACRCSARPYPHIHSPEDKKRAIDAWNRDSKHKIGRVQ